MKWGKCCACITKQDSTDFCNKCCRANCFCKADSMVTWVWLCQRCKFAGCFPVKLTAINNDTTNRSSMSTNKFCCRMYNNVCTILNRTDQIWCSKCIINDKWNLVCMCNLSMPSISTTSEFGFPNVSMKTALVLS